ncbi:MAG TPA: extracellular solute-binding protein [Iamia sp.]|nr:extracellular solute-binding protein [Iamia sp.]
MSTRFRARGRAVAAIAVTSLLVLSACGGDDDDAGGGGGGGEQTLNIVGFAVPEEANNAIYEKFKETDAGADAAGEPEGSYGASGDQSRAVEGGLEADYVHFSIEPDVTRLVESGQVAEDWNQNDTDGIVSRSVVVFVVEEGNPLGIETWDDLLQDDVEIITPNPGSSGAAKWNILAAYGQAIAGGASEDEAKQYLTDFVGNVAALPGSGRDATTAFKDGTGNVLISYENEAILARQSGEAFDYVVPDTTLLIENPGAILEDADPIAQPWLDFVLSDEGQTEFVKKGFRPVIDDLEIPEVEGANDPADPFPTPGTLLTVGEAFGGWSEANAFFDEEDGFVTAILQESGKAE